MADPNSSPHDVVWSTTHTLGVERELHTVRESDQQLVCEAPRVLSALRRVAVDGRYEPELMANTVEVVTPVVASVAEGVASLRRLVGVACEVAADHGLALSPLALHPFADPHAQTVSDTPRYRDIMAREQMVGAEQQMIGLHIHVGVPSGEAALAAMDHLAVWTPLFIALGASSPFHQGRDTGFESFRPMLVDRLPPSGVAPSFDTWDSFCDWFDQMQSSGFVDGLNDIWWDVRPTRYGTVEMRIIDGHPGFTETGALMALTQCLVAEAASEGFERSQLPRDVLRLNRFEAQRYGLDAEVALVAGEPRRVLAEYLAETVTRLQPIAERLGCADELNDLSVFAVAGSSARQQRKVMAETGSLNDVVRHATQQLRSEAGDVDL